MPYVLSTQGKNKLRQIPVGVLSFLSAVLRWEGAELPAWPWLLRPPTEPPHSSLSHPHSSVRSSSGAQINLFQRVVASHLAGIGGRKNLFSKRHFCPMLLHLEEFSGSRHLLWRSNKKKHP